MGTAMKNWLLRALYALPLLLVGGYALSDYTATQGTGTTVFSFVCSVSKVCPASVLINSSNVEIATSGNPLRTDPTGSTTQPVSGTVTANAGTNLNTSALATSANQTNASQKTQIVDGSGNVIASTSNALNVNVNNTNANGSAISSSSSPVVIASDQAAVAVKNGASSYKPVAASQTATTLGATGAIGDYLSHCIIYPTSTSPGVVTVFDSTNTAANSAILFVGGATSTSNLAPIPVPVGAVSVNGAWKVTTGANISVVCVGKFT